jgi:molybdate transport system substrate-binding protein
MRRKLILLGLYLAAGPWAAAQGIRIAFGTGMRDVAEALVEEFSRQTGHKPLLVAASPDETNRQAKTETSCDVWLTKDLGQLNNLYLAGRAAEKPRVFAKSSMVQVAGRTAPANGDGNLQNLTRNEVKKIVVMAPAGSAQGKETVRMLHNAGIYDQVKEKLLYATNQSEMRYYLSTKAADVGIASTTQAERSGQWQTIDQKLYRPTEYGVALLKGSPAPQWAVAQAFVQFLFSAKAKAILRNYGYEPA